MDIGINHLLARQGIVVLHACAFELGGISVLGLGESFSGKTTVSVAAMRALGKVVSNDTVMVAPDEHERLALLTIRSFGWLRGRTKEFVPKELQEKLKGADEKGQSSWVLRRVDGDARYARRTNPDVIWIQSVDRRLRESRIEPANQGEVFGALIRGSTPLYLSRHCPDVRDKLIPVYRSLCSQCRGFRVRLGCRLLEEPDAEISRLVQMSGDSRSQDRG